jgi:hypothetical protein
MVKGKDGGRDLMMPLVVIRKKISGFFSPPLDSACRMAMITA